TTIRFQIEAQPVASRLPSDAQLRELTRAAAGWRVMVLPSSRVPAGRLPDGADPQLRRLTAMLLVPKPASDIDAGQLYYDLPLRGAPDRRGEPEVIGMLEIARSAEVVDASGDDLQRVVVLVLLIVGITTLMVGVFAMRLVSRPITKLLRGIDDVAKGDLSHV